MILFERVGPLGLIHTRNAMFLNLLKNDNFIIVDADSGALLDYGTYKFKREEQDKIHLELSNYRYQKLLLRALNWEIALNIQNDIIEYYSLIPCLDKDLINIIDLKTGFLNINKSHKYFFYVLGEKVKFINGYMDFNPSYSWDKISISYRDPKNVIKTSVGYIYLGIDTSCNDTILIKEEDAEGNLIRFYYY